jgi:hypothetical protein
MRTILTTFACLAGLVFATAVAAQGPGTGSATMPGPATSGTAHGGGVTGAGSGAPAPIGHRQPTAGDVATATQTPEERAEAAADAKLDRALHSICRGC